MLDFTTGSVPLPQNSGVDLTAPVVPEADPFKVQPQPAPGSAINAQPGPGIAATFGAAFMTEWPFLSASFDTDGARAWTLDPNYDPKKLDEAQRKALYDGLDEKLWHEYDGSVSFEHALAIRNRLDTAQQYHNTLEQSGLTGTAATFVAAMTDPGTIATIAGSEGLAVPALLAKFGKAGRLARVAIHATVGAESNALAEIPRVVVDPYRDSTDVLMAAGVGMFVGGAFGSFAKGGDALESAFANSGRRLMDAAHAADEAAPGSLSAATTAGRSEMFLGGKDEEALQWAKENRVAGRAVDATGFSPAGTSGEVAGQFDISGGLLGSVHDMISAVSRYLVRNSSGRTFQEATAHEIATTEAEAAMARYLRQSSPAYIDWATAKGYNAVTRQSPVLRATFDEEVARAKRLGGSEDPHVNRAAGALRQGYDDWLTQLKAHGIQGFENVEFNPNYMQRLWKSDAITGLEKTYGVPQVDRFLRQALVQGSEGITSDEADTVVRALKKAVLSGEWDMEKATSMSLSRADVQKIREAVISEVEASGHTDETKTEGFVDDLMNLLRNAEGRGNPDRAQRRLRFDEGFTMPMSDAATGESRVVALQDLFENNATSLFESYSRQAAGTVALAKTLGVKSQGEIDSLLRRIRKTAPKFYDASDKGRARFDHDYSHLDMLLRGIQGRSIDTNPNEYRAAKEFAANFRHYNFVRLMGSAGLAQLSDLGNALGLAGWTNALPEMIPALRSLIRDASTGRLNDDLSDELEVALAAGTDRLLNVPSARLDEFSGAAVGSAWLRTATRAVADVSLMNPINATMEMVAVRAAVQNFAKNALKEGAGWGEKRLAMLGISPERAKAISKSINDHSDWTEGGLTGRKIARLNLDDWDKPTAEAFTYALRRHLRIAIQKNDLGDLTPLMTNWLAKTVLQFRSFMQVAWSKQFLNGVHMRDGYTFQAWAGSMLFGGLAYIANTYASGAGRADRDKYLADHLTPAEIGKAAFQRAGFSSIIPSTIDTGMQLTRHDPLFSFRTTGLQTSFLSGSPIVDTVDTGYKTLQALSDVASGSRRFNQADFRTATKLLPIQNFYAIKGGLNAIAETLPKERNSGTSGF